MVDIQSSYQRDPESVAPSFQIELVPSGEALCCALQYSRFVLHFFEHTLASEALTCSNPTS
jgi:hypothetical protein